MTDNLTPRQSDFLALFPFPGQDVGIEVLYREFLGRAPEPHTSRRQMQQEIGTWITRINERLTNSRIEPGVARGTYRVVLR